MVQCAVIADDLTGGNATGVLLAKMGYKAYTILNAQGVSLNTVRDCDCLIYPTDSRAINPDEAYCRVKNIAESLSYYKSNIKIWSKRIDSTLRGNIGSETDAMLDAVSKMTGDNFIAISAPCFPSSGRTLVGGYLLVDGLPLHRTNIAIDPKTPVKSSDMVKLFRSKYKVASIELNDLMNGKHYLAGKINFLSDEGNKIIVIDCVTQEDLDLIADAAITSKKNFIAVDPGAFTATLARKLIAPHEKKERRKILAVVGSVNPNTKSQMEELWLAQHPIANIFVETSQLLKSDSARNSEISRVTSEALEKSSLNTIITVTGDGIYPEKRIDFSKFFTEGKSIEEITSMINNSLAEIALRILKSEPLFKGIYASGGDVTQALCEKFGASGLDLKDEVLPLAAYGLFSGGEFEGLHVVTKGGSQGNSDAINLCVNYLKSKLFI